MSQVQKALWGSAVVLAIWVTVYAFLVLYVIYSRMTDVLAIVISDVVIRIVNGL